MKHNVFSKHYTMFVPALEQESHGHSFKDHAIRIVGLYGHSDDAHEPVIRTKFPLKITPHPENSISQVSVLKACQKILNVG